MSSTLRRQLNSQDCSWNRQRTKKELKKFIDHKLAHLETIEVTIV